MNDQESPNFEATQGQNRGHEPASPALVNAHYFSTTLDDRNMRYGGFWIRVFAYLIDTSIC
ncbi:MAG: hypothetical protein ACRETL_05380, partial [Gammaproteobacteria bacterium]